MPAIAIRHLAKTFEQKGNSVEALRDISLDIEEGDIYGIIGMSGAGKSTLVRCLNYLERPTSGEVIIGGRDLGTLTEKELREQIREETRRELETELREIRIRANRPIILRLRNVDILIEYKVTSSEILANSRKTM